MCGRYYLRIKIENLIERYNLDLSKRQLENKSYQLLDKGEIFPGNNAAVITADKTKRLNFYQWGFIPPFTSSPIINARAESIEKKPLFKKSFFNSRCIIPASFFFEWKGQTKYRIADRDHTLLSLAGLYSVFKDKKGQEKVCFTIITTNPNQSLSPIHDRMPVILGIEAEKKWLNSQFSETENLKKLLKPCPDSKITIEKDIEKNQGKQLSFDF